MYWPYKTTVLFVDGDGCERRVRYAVSAGDGVEARSELERRLLGQEVDGFTVESAIAVTVGEATNLRLPAGCVQLLG